MLHVAVGSHAVFLSAGIHPIATECLPATAIQLLQAQGLPLPMDYAFPGPA